MTAAPKTDNARRLFEVVGERGMTWQEYAAASGSHHGSASAMLSKLHQRGEIARLTEKRENSTVYVTPANVNGRPEAGPRAKGPAKVAEPVAETVDVEVLLAAMDALAELQRVAERIELEALLEVELELVRDEMLLERDADREHHEVVLKSAVRNGELLRQRGSAKLSEEKERHTRELAKEIANATSKARDEGEAVGWQAGYDEGIKRGQETTHGGDAFTEGRALGRNEGEEMVRRRVHMVSVEMYKTIVETAPVRTHFKGCYKIHPECAVKALGRSAGIAVRPIGLSAAG